MSNSSYNFTAIDSEAFVLQTCDQLVQIWEYFQFRNTGDEENFTAYGSDNIYRYIVQGLETYLSSHSLQKPPENQEFWDWSKELQSVITNTGNSKCPSEMCRAIGWGGSPDIAGVGMLATYIIQATLVTIYLFSILVIRLDCVPPRLQKSRMLSRTLLSIQHSTAEFLSASSIFSLSLLVAAINSNAQAVSGSWSTGLLAIVIPLNSIFPVIILHVVASSMLRRSKGRVFSWLVMDVLTLTLFVTLVFPNISTGPEDGVSKNGDNFSSDTSPCIRSSLFDISIFLYTVTGVVLFGITAYVVDAIVSMTRHRPGMIERLPDIVQWVIIGASLCTMWFLMGWFVNLTIGIRSRAGDKNGDNEWSFGQVLALATWIPFIVEFGYIWWETPLKALNGRLMAPYEVVATSEEES